MVGVAKVSGKDKEELIETFAKGEILFVEGSPGGDLYFIQQGQVEIFTTKDHQEVVLAHMGAGEVIGVLTCMTNEPRLAGARAKIETVCKKVKHENIARLMKEMPPWLRTVLKEYGNRLSNMNKLYGETTTKLERMKTAPASLFYTTAQLCNLTQACTKFIAKNVDNKSVIIVDELLDHASEYLGRPRNELKSIMDIIIENGMVKIQIEQDRKRQYFALENVPQLKIFSDFILNSSRGMNRKILQTQFAIKEGKILAALFLFAKKTDANLKTEIKVKISDLETGMEKSTGTKFSLEPLGNALKIQLLAVENAPDGDKLVFNPADVANALSFQAAYRTLEKMTEAALARQEAAVVKK